MDPRRQIVKELTDKKELKQLEEVHTRQLNNEDRRLFFHSLEFEEPEQEFYWDYYDFGFQYEELDYDLGFQYEQLDYDLGFQYEEFDYRDDFSSIQISPSPSTYAVNEIVSSDKDSIQQTMPSLSDYMERLLKVKSDLYRQKHTWSRLVLRILKTLRQKICEWRKTKNYKDNEQKKQKSKGRVISRASKWIRKTIGGNKNNSNVDGCKC